MRRGDETDRATQGGEGHVKTQRECHVKSEAEIKVMVSISQRMLRVASKCQKNIFFPRSFREIMDLLTPQFWTSSL